MNAPASDAPAPGGLPAWSRTAEAAVLGAAGVPGLLFEPVFGWWAVVTPVVAVLVTCALVVELCRRVPALGPWRLVLALVAGLLVLAETLLWHTTHLGLPTGATLRALLAGMTESWQLTLQSTWPARPDAELLLFVPLAVLFAAVLGTELLRRPLLALLPSLLLVGLSQAYLALGGTAAITAALGYACFAAVLLVASRGGYPRTPIGGRVRAALRVLPTAALGAAATVVAVTAAPVQEPAYSLRQNSSVPVPPTRLSNPLTDVAARLREPDTPVFTYRSAGRVERWRLAVLSEFDGVSWSPGPAHLRRMGATVDLEPTVDVPTTEHTAVVTVPDSVLPWLPSQALPEAVTATGFSSASGIAPLIDQDSGMLVAPGRGGPVRYELRWREQVVDAETLSSAAIDPTAAGGFAGLGQVPGEVARLASTAVGGMRPSFRTALVLDRYLSEHYRLATGRDLPTGSGWPQLREFLLDTKRGTSEQFAAAYVVLARQLGIPARLAVGFRAPPATAGEVVVRNGDVLVWPEVAVAGVGWVPLDPTGKAGGAARSGSATGGLAETTARVRAGLPPTEELRDPRLPQQDDGSEVTRDGLALHPFVGPVLLGLLVVLVAAGAAIPSWRAVRAWRRRRLTGAHGVVAAWWEARDRLRAHGVPLTAAMTVREMAAVAAGTAGGPVTDGLHMLARLVDLAMWSGQDPSRADSAEAWVAVELVNAGLARRPLVRRVRAAFDPSSLFPPRAAPPRGWSP